MVAITTSEKFFLNKNNELAYSIISKIFKELVNASMILIFVSGIGPRHPETNEIVGGAIKDENGKPMDYDIKAQTKQVLENIKSILEEVELSLEDVVDCLCFLVDMERDFTGFNEVYGEYFSEIMAARTTVAVRALPTPIAVELKVIAKG